MLASLSLAGDNTRDITIAQRMKWYLDQVLEQYADRLP